MNLVDEKETFHVFFHHFFKHSDNVNVGVGIDVMPSNTQ